MKTRRRRPQRQLLKMHRSYTVDEAARCLAVAKGTVRRWIKKGLPAIQDKRPVLILGAELAAYLGRSKQRTPCEPHQCYCVKCRSPRGPAGNLAEYIPLTPYFGNLRAICPVCERLMHRRVSLAALPSLRMVLDVSLTVAPERIAETPDTSLNEHLLKAS